MATRISFNSSGDVRHPTLFDDDADLTPSAAWDRLQAPAGYEQQWGQLRRAAEDASMSPAELSQIDSDARSGFDRLVGERGWKKRTAVLYAKVASYGGIVVSRDVTPEPTVQVSSLAPLVVMRDDAGLCELRAVAWCALALGWPASLDDWRHLQVADIKVAGAAVLLDGREIRGAAPAWQRWMHGRLQTTALAESPHALCTVRGGDWPDELQGNPVSRRGLQAAFARHVAMVTACMREADRPDANTISSLTYDTVRRLVIASGVKPVVRGQVRALRAQRLRFDLRQ